MEREALAVALDECGTDTAVRVAAALHAGADFWVTAEMMQTARHYDDVWSHRARHAARQKIATCKDFDLGLPALRRAGDAKVALGRVDTADGVHVLFMAADLGSCVAVL